MNFFDNFFSTKMMNNMCDKLQNHPLCMSVYEIIQVFSLFLKYFAVSRDIDTRSGLEIST